MRALAVTAPWASFRQLGVCPSKMDKESRTERCWTSTAGEVSGAWSLAAGGETSRGSCRKPAKRALKSTPGPKRCQEYRTSAGVLPQRKRGGGGTPVSWQKKRWRTYR
ncbi:hypothetical protein NDU88_002505 [Pleurodeles waltl]|uniref:Secreted protein n=1 Tax=Pleurodeles waltl TaxID=8319 RepID=A0AAV7W3H1_PLEWA|nr:hypothetical protein NDU88_002505 [Pleurodeles waltl]